MELQLARTAPFARFCAPLLCCWTMFACGKDGRAENALESALASRPIADLAKGARILGDPTRGAVTFHRRGLSCTPCHSVGHAASPDTSIAMSLGPDLTLLRERATYEHVVESILQPSRVMRDGYRAETVLLSSGQVFTGLVRSETNDQIVVVVPGENIPRTIRRDEIDERVVAQSIMPAGLMNQLRDESEFFDLVAFVVALGQAGPERTKDLLQDAASLAPEPLPAYERDLDHRGLISAWNGKSFKKGEAVYNGLCINCHGTEREPGSLPNALRFATGTFRNGADPWSMYKTITHGYRMMAPQQLTPEVKYDVVHYIREAFLKEQNTSQYVPLTSDYLASLPTGSERGPKPMESHPWRDMDYGPFLINTYELVGPDAGSRPVISKAEEELAEKEHRPVQETWPAGTNFAYKGIAVRLDAGPGGVAAGSHWIIFDHDTLRVAGAWSGEGFVDWEGILLNGRHAIAPRTIGEQHFANLPGPGWADPATGSFEDPRLRGRDGNPYGPLPRTWAHYRGVYKHGDRVVISYSVGDASILESYRLERSQETDVERARDVWVRVLNVGRSSHDLTLRVAPQHSASATVTGGNQLRLAARQGETLLRIPAAQTPLDLELRISANWTAGGIADDRKTQPEDLRLLTRGGPSAWPQSVVAIPHIGDDDGPLVADVLSRPASNPWKCRMRFSGLDFLDDESQSGDARLAVCSCDGDVWVVQDVDELGDSISWRRIASGLFQPLGIKRVGGKIFVGCRDQIVVLHDLNGDGETDYYENFNNDHQVTDHFHEFAMGLQADADRNLFYAKSARHARDSLVPQHGTLLRVDADGSKTTILANGFRAANGVCLNPDGSFFVTDQEGHWTPMNRINRVVEGGFYGNMYSYGAPKDSGDEAMAQPICWPNKEMDRSPAELVWVDSAKWGPLNGSLLSLSYGTGEIFLVPHERVVEQWQGGICRLPLPKFPTGVIRARFHPRNGQMYVCGMQAWGTDQTEESGGLYRVRYTGRPLHLPMELHARRNGVEIRFTEPLDRSTGSDPTNYLIEVWSLRRTAAYGSSRFDEMSLAATSAAVSNDGRSVTLEIAQLKPTQCMRIAYQLKDAGGATFLGEIHNTIHRLP